MSANVRSCNVPDYQAPKCFVSNGLDSEQGEEREEADSEDESRGINLIASDNEDDEEEIEPEDEQDNKRNNSIDPC